MVAGAQIAPLPADEARALDRDGYLIFRATIPGEWLGPLRERFEAAVLPSDRWPVPRGKDWRHALLDADPLVRRVCKLPGLLSAAHHILKGPFFLAQAEGREPLRDGGHQPLHRDGMPEALGRNVSALAFLDPFGPDNGATRLVPGSHASGRPEPEIGIAGEAGDVVLFDADLLHAGSRNVSGARRRSLLIGYAGQELLATFERTNALRGLSDAPREIFGATPVDALS